MNGNRKIAWGGGANLTKSWEVTCDGLVSHPWGGGGGGRNPPSRFILQKPEISAGTDETGSRLNLLFNSFLYV